MTSPVSSAASAGRAGSGPGAAAGVVVVGHGTADPVGADETRAVARMVADLLPGVPVELGFLEVIGPSIGDAVTRLAARGCRALVASPLLLFAAGHARRDVPEALADAAAAAGLVVQQAEPLGTHPDVVALSRRRRAEAVAGRPDVSPEDVVLVMIGRGASDPSAHGQLRGFAEATCPATPPGAAARLEIGFVAAARPTLAEALEAACDPQRGRPRRIIVQPHLLFRGHVEGEVAAAVERARREHPECEWLQAGRLGADEAVARAVVARAHAAAAAASPGGPSCGEERR